MKISVKERREKKKLKEASIEKAMSVMAKYNKRQDTDEKKKDYNYFIKVLGSLYNSFCVIRPPEEWVCRSFNYQKQLFSFIKHIYCNYNVPSFMLNLFDRDSSLYVPSGSRLIRNNGSRNYNYGKLSKLHDEDLLFSMFITAASGKSFYKTYSYLFTKKEAHAFLNGRPDLTIRENFWRAKIIAAGGTDKLYNICSDFFPNSIIQNKDNYSSTMYDAVQFLARFSDGIDRDSFLNIMDYIRWETRLNNNKFSFKGKTLSSIIKASNKWHKDVYANRYITSYSTFKVCPIKDFKRVCPKSGTEWNIKQILDSNSLYKEGQAMKHCVATYSHRCVDGDSYIFSVSNSFGRTATVELSKFHTVRQVRGKLNSTPDNETIDIISLWLKENRVNCNLNHLKNSL